MQGELVALREEGSGGQKRGSGVGFVHQQKSALAAPSAVPCVILGIFWTAKLHLQGGNRRNYRYRGGKAEPGWIFLTIS